MNNSYVQTPNMGLNLPVPSLDPGPDWAAALNAALAFVDQHTHNVGSGVQITPSGLNINANLPFSGYGPTGLGFVNLALAATPSLDTSLYSPDGVNLWFLDGNGNNFAITSGGGVTATNGSLAGGTAQAAFVSNALVVNSVQSTGVPGNVQLQSVLFGNASAGTDFVTVSAPSSTTTYGLVLPTIPAATSFLQLDTSGNITGAVATANGITRANLAAVGQQISSSCGSYALNTGSSNVAITNLAVTITTSGRPVIVALVPDESGNLSGLEFSVTGSAVLNGVAYINVLRTGTSSGSVITTSPSANVAVPNTGGSGGYTQFPFSIFQIDPVAAGTYTYTAYSASAQGNAHLLYTKLIAYEL